MDEKIKKAIQDLKDGKFIMVFDAEDREAEVDFIMAAEFSNPVNIRQMRQDGGGLIFLMVANEPAMRLQLPFMADIYADTKDRYPIFEALVPNDIPYDEKSSFSLAINHRKTFTGITDNDRSLTVSDFSRVVKNTKGLSPDQALKMFGEHFRSPGHVPICVASEKPLSKRFGHTELSVALMLMAGLTPVAVGCEIMGDDGKAKSKIKVQEYSEQNNLTFLEGKEIVEAWKAWSG
jgi:3,4-dihydroxy 2-butanone 4-phosphate synthase